MGKSSSTSTSTSSTTSCLKLIACGSNSGTASDTDDFDHLHPTTTTTTTKTKASGDKRGWSFRKKGGRHRVLGNNVTSESTTVADKEVPLVIKTEFQAPVKSTSADEKPQLPEPVDKAGEDTALECDGVSKKSVEVIASENDYSVTCEKPKIGQVLVASDNDSNSTSTEVDDTVVPENNSFEPSFELGIDNESVVHKSESNDMAKTETLNSEGASEDGSDVSIIVDEPVAIVLQASIRGFLAQQEFSQLKNIVMLQAVIRGHLVRRNAVESLHCIRSIAKVQALVRAHSAKTMDQNYKKSEGQFSTEKLLKNSFARQLLKATPKPKSVNIRCDPLSPNSAWGWLERWMSVSSEVSREVEPSADLENGNQVQSNHAQEDDGLSTVSPSDSFVSKGIMDDNAKLSETEGNHCQHVVGTIESQSSPPTFVEIQQSHNQLGKFSEDMNSSRMDGVVNTPSVSPVELVSHADEAAAEIPHPKLSGKRLASEELSGEGKKLSCRSRNVAGPMVIVTQSDIEGLSSAANSSKTVSSSNQNVGIDQKVEADTSSSLVETFSKTSDPSVVVVDVPSDPQNLVAGSECGTELSVTSTLDSPDRCELEITQPEPPVKIFGLDGSKDELDCETDGVSSNNIQQEEVHVTNGSVSASPIVAEVIPQVEQKIEMEASDEPLNFTCTDGNSDVITPKEDLNEQSACLEHVVEGFQAEKLLSPEASPRSHMTVPESQGTPSSQVSVKDRRNKSGKSGSIPKPSSRSVSKRSPSNPNLDSGGRSSVEHLPKDHKSGKRRNSFGSTKSDTDHEPRDSSSNSSLPSYMQATKSAKAKAHSPKSSPDFHDKEVTPKKRQSLPGNGGRQGSPRIQRSSSEAAQGGKPIGSHPSNERKWQR